MFWKQNNAGSSIETLLNKQDVTLLELMNEDDIINECKLKNKELVEFLLKPEVMQELVTLTTEEPSGDMDEKIRFKYPNVACEILTCDIPALNERLASDKELLGKLYSFLDNEPPLNPLLASYFSKIMGVLIAKMEQKWFSYQYTCLQVLDFLKEKDNFISLLLKHLNTSAIMDLVLKLMTQVEGPEIKQNILNWLDSQRIIQELIGLMVHDVESDKHFNIAQLLCDFIKIARDNQRNSSQRSDPDPLLNTLESTELLSTLLDNMLGENKCESAIVGGIQILLGLLDVTRNSIPKYNSQSSYNSSSYDEYDLEYKQKVVENVTKAVVKRLKDFNHLLLNPPKKPPISTTAGVLNPPLGNTRLHIIKLFACLISLNNDELLEEFIALDTMQILLDLFFQYPWNNFLHSQVEICVLSALKLQVPSEEGDCNALCKHLLVNCKLISRILDSWKANDEEQAKESGVRQGYMGHLISILNSIVEMCSTTPLGQFLKDNLPEMVEDFEKFRETTLAETNKTRDILLGGENPNSMNKSNHNYSDVVFNQLGLINQEVFTEYQMHPSLPHYFETMAFDEDFNDMENSLQTIESRTGNNFDLSEGDLIQQHELFKEICDQNISTLDDDDDQIFEDKEHTFQTVIEKKSERHDAVYNSDSDEDLPEPADPITDADPWSEFDWPYLNDLSNKQLNKGWADFSSAFDNVDPIESQAIASQGGSVAKSTVVEADLKVENIENDAKEQASLQQQEQEQKKPGMDGNGEKKETQTQQQQPKGEETSSKIDESIQKQNSEIQKDTKDTLPSERDLDAEVEAVTSELKEMVIDGDNKKPKEEKEKEKEKVEDKKTA